jgi:hypothetical protein
MAAHGGCALALRVLATCVRVVMAIASTTVSVDRADGGCGAAECGRWTLAHGDDAAVYDGHAGQTTVHVPRLDAHIDVDGALTAAPWRQAAVLTGFSEYTPIDGQPAEDSTEVLVWYSPTAIYFGIRAYEPHGAVHATLADRDKIDADDNIQLILSPFLHSRQALPPALPSRRHPAAARGGAGLRCSPLGAGGAASRAPAG